jgi:tRNA (guanine37-N1)-methyltransferase
MALIDAVVRHLPGVLGDEVSPEDESFADGLLEHGQYTRPAEYRGWSVPEVLLGGNHAAIEAWRAAQRLERTRARRPDLLERASPPGVESLGRSAARVRIREVALGEDFGTITALWSEAGNGIEPGVSDTLDELRKLDRELFLAAEGRDGIVGTAIGGFDGRCGHVYHIAVAPRFRGRKVGEALMAELESRLRSRGCLRMNLHVMPGSWQAMRFFERLGWERLSVNVYGRDL